MLYVFGAIVAMVLISTALNITDRRPGLSLTGAASPVLAPNQVAPATGVWALAERELGWYGAFEATSAR
ncbi:MAG: hypothetical protein M3474_00875 [Actinomycetota bacterium]|nr:hypothetical protein [Actinomycetota bacterium]